MKQIALYLLAIIGVLTIAKGCYSYNKFQRDAHGYLKNCKNVRVGMTLQEAKKVMGDLYYYDRTNRSFIWTPPYGNFTEYEYWLVYPKISGYSSGPKIYFEPNTQIVRRVDCGDD